MKKQISISIALALSLGAQAAGTAADSAIPVSPVPLEAASVIRAQAQEAARRLERDREVEQLLNVLDEQQQLLADGLNDAGGSVQDTRTAPETELPAETEAETEAHTAPETEAETEAELPTETESVPVEMEAERIDLFDYRMLRDWPLSNLPKDLHVLYRQLQEMTDGWDGIWSVYVQDLSTNQALIVNDVPMRSASVMKLFIMETVYEAFSKGTLARDETSVYLLRNMIINSSNDSSNRLLSMLGDGDLSAGIAKVNDFIRLHGFSDGTAIHNGFQDPATFLDPGNPNVLTAKDVGLLLSRVYNRTFLSRRVCNEIESMMLEQGTRYKIPRGLPDGVECGNKSGETSEIANDAAVVYASSTDYILVVLSQNWGDENTANANIVTVSQAVYHFFEG